MTVKFLTLALCSSLALTACKDVSAESKLPPQPPIWIVSDADSEITLYPTLHILPSELEWKSDEMRKRLSAAEEVWFEILPGSETDPALQQVMFGLGMNPGSSISSKLTEDEQVSLKKAVAPLGMPFEAIDQMRPWLVSTFVGVGALVDSGFDPNAGVEKQLVPLAEGKRFRALETAEDQMTMLATLPDNVQMQMLKDSLNELVESVQMIHELAEDWSIGDIVDLEDELLDEMKSQTPEAYDVLFTSRNKNWVSQIEKEMAGSGTDFIAVGAGHLVGEDGVPALLRAKGFTVERL